MKKFALLESRSVKASRKENKSNLRRLYESYGGFPAMVKSGYFWAAALITLASWRLSTDDRWAGISQTILPTLAGFSIAAYALFFAVLNEKDRNALRAPSPELKNRSPLLMLASAISHAAIVQIVGVIFAILFTAKPIPTIELFRNYYKIANIIFSSFGIFFMNYGIVLIVASVVTIFRMIEIKPATKPKAPPNSSTPPAS